MSTETAEQIRRYVEAIDSMAPPIDINDIRQAEETGSLFVSPPPAPHRSRRRTIVLAAAAFLTVVGIAAAVLSRGDETRSDVTTDPDPGESGAGPFVWRAVGYDSDSLPPSQVFQDRGTVTATDSGFLAIDRGRGLWMSMDGASWTRGPLPGEFSVGADGRAYQAGDDVVLVKSEAQRGREIWTTQDGVAWTEQNESEWPDMESTEWIVSSAATIERTVLPWSDTEALSWVVEFPDQLVAYRVSENCDLLATGCGGPRTQRGASFEVLTSRDGETWNPSAIDGIFEPAGVELASSQGINCCVFAVRGGVAVANVFYPGEGKARLWRSEDGISWQDVTPGTGVSNGIWATDELWVSGLMDSFADRGQQAQVVVSVDGFDWQPLPLPDSTGVPVCVRGGCHLVAGLVAGDTIFLPVGEGDVTRNLLVGSQRSNP